MDNISHIPKPDEILEYDQEVEDDNAFFQTALKTFNDMVTNECWVDEKTRTFFIYFIFRDIVDIPFCFRKKILKKVMEHYGAAGWTISLRKGISEYPFFYPAEIYLSREKNREDSK